MSEKLTTREGVEQDYPYLMFDWLYEKVLQGHLTLEELKVEYKKVVLDTPNEAQS